MMSSKTLRKGRDANSLRLLVDSVEIKSDVKMMKGIMESGVIIKLHQYNLEDLLCQLLEDYGEEKLIEEIKKLE